MKGKKSKQNESFLRRFLGWFSLPKLSYIAGIVAAVVVVATFIINIFNEGNAPGHDNLEEIVVSAFAEPSNPTQFSKVIIYVEVKDNNEEPVSNALVEATAHYRTTNTPRKGITDYNGICNIEYWISGATIGYEVRVDVTAHHKNVSASTYTSFTPTER